MDIDNTKIPRKTVLAGLGAGAVGVTLAACSGGDSGTAAEPGSDSGGPESTAGAEPLTSTADVPVESGVIVGDVVVTQPVAGEFLAFSAVCTHSGCLVNQVADGTINCPCHGSKFGLDGEVVNGPAARPLTAVPVEVQGDSIVVA